MVRNTIGLLQKEDGHLSTLRQETRQGCLMLYWPWFSTLVVGFVVPKLEDHNCETDKLPANPEFVQYLLFHPNPHKSVGLDGIHVRILSWLMSL